MLHLSRTSWLLTLTAVLALRLVIGWHFYQEGVSKLKAGDFDPRPFLSSAIGPAAPWFHKFLDDASGAMRLGLVRTRGEDGQTAWTLDPLVTEQLWKGFAYRAARHYGFGDPKWSEQMRQRAEQSEARGREAESAGDDPRAEACRRQAAEDRAAAAAVAEQKEAVLAVVDRYLQLYRGLLDDHRSEILAYFQGAERLEGFERDGVRRSAVAQQVSSLRQQVERVAAERRSAAGPWLAEVEGLWDGVEADVNALAVAAQRGVGAVRLDRPYQPRWSAEGIIRWGIPWFDAVVGGLLIVGLLTRLAALAGMALLAGVVATQPFWIPAAAPTAYPWIELVGLLLLFAISAGHIAGLDAVLFRRRARAAQPESSP